jgi:hypothetical protein
MLLQDFWSWISLTIHMSWNINKCALMFWRLIKKTWFFWFKSCISVQALFLLKLRYLPTLHFVTKIIKMKIKNTKLSENNRPIEKKIIFFPILEIHPWNVQKEQLQNWVNEDKANNYKQHWWMEMSKKKKN